METKNDDRTGLPEEAPTFSPKLKTAAAEIKAILEKHDIAGIIQLHEPGFNEHTVHLNPTWSLAHLDEKNQLVVTDPIQDPEHPEVHKKKIADTVNMMANLRVWAGNFARLFMQADIVVRTKFGMMPPPGGPKIVKPGPKPGEQGGRSKFIR